MLSSFYNDIAVALRRGLVALKLPKDSFGLKRGSNQLPYFQVSGSQFTVKVPQFKKTEHDSQLIATADTFVIPRATALKKGPFELLLTPSAITAISITTKPGTAQAAIEALKANQYTLRGNKLRLAANYAQNTELNVAYQFEGIEFADRFTQQFTLDIFEPDPIKVEQYVLLSMAAIWVAWEGLVGKEYRQLAGRLATQVKPTELCFNGQVTPSQDTTGAAQAQLNFAVNGLLTLVKITTGGLHRIQEVDLGQEVVHKDDEGGLTITRNQP